MPKVFTIISMIISKVFFITGLLDAMYPQKMWEIFESWKAAREPAKTYFILRRIAGIIAMLLFPYLMSIVNG